MRLAAIIIWILFIIGYGMNIYKLCNCDFKEPYKAEIIRSIGVVVVPLGSIAGYCYIND